MSNFCIVCRRTFLGFMNNIFILCSNFRRMVLLKIYTFAFTHLAQYSYLQKSFRFMNDVCIIYENYFRYSKQFVAWIWQFPKNVHIYTFYIYAFNTMQLLFTNDLCFKCKNCSHILKPLHIEYDNFIRMV